MRLRYYEPSGPNSGNANRKTFISPSTVGMTFDTGFQNYLYKGPVFNKNLEIPPLVMASILAPVPETNYFKRPGPFSLKKPPGYTPGTPGVGYGPAPPPAAPPQPPTTTKPTTAVNPTMGRTSNFRERTQEDVFYTPGTIPESPSVVMQQPQFTTQERALQTLSTLERHMDDNLIDTIQVTTPQGMIGELRRGPDGWTGHDNMRVAAHVSGNDVNITAFQAETPSHNTIIQEPIAPEVMHTATRQEQRLPEMEQIAVSVPATVAITRNFN